MTIENKLSVLEDPRAAGVLAQLHRACAGQAWGILGALWPQLHRLALRRHLDWSRLEPRLDSQPLAIDLESGLFLFMMARACRARDIVEFGTSTGVSTIYLALAARERGGTVIATELLPQKLDLARQHVQAAGLERYVDFRLGDARETLLRSETPVDFFHNDGFPAAALPVLQLLSPRMRRGAVTLCGNAALFPADHAEYLRWVRNPENGFSSIPLPMKLGGELSIRASGPVAGFSEGLFAQHDDPGLHASS